MTKFSGILKDMKDNVLKLLLIFNNFAGAANEFTPGELGQEISPIEDAAPRGKT